MTVPSPALRYQSEWEPLEVGEISVVARFLWDPWDQHIILIIGQVPFWQKAALLANAWGKITVTEPACLFMLQLETRLCHQLIRQTLDIMEKAAEIAETEGMLLDCCGPALCSTVWDIFKRCTPAHPPPRHLLLASHPTPCLLSAVQLISSILFLSRTCNREKDTERERREISEREDGETCLIPTSVPSLPAGWRNDTVYILGWMFHDLPAWNVNTKWSTKIIPGAFSFLSSSSLPLSHLSLSVLDWSAYS